LIGNDGTRISSLLKIITNKDVKINRIRRENDIKKTHFIKVSFKDV